MESNGFADYSAKQGFLGVTRPMEDEAIKDRAFPRVQQQPESLRCMELEVSNGHLA